MSSIRVSVRELQVEAGAEELGLSLEKYLDATSFWETSGIPTVLFGTSFGVAFSPNF